MTRTSTPPTETTDRTPADPRLNAYVHLAVARQAAALGEVEHACYRYRTALDAWRMANESNCNRWLREQERTNREYASFLLGHIPRDC